MEIDLTWERMNCRGLKLHISNLNCIFLNMDWLPNPTRFSPTNRERWRSGQVIHWRLVIDMDEDIERFHRLVLAYPHESKMVITPDKGFPRKWNDLAKTHENQERLVPNGFPTVVGSTTWSFAINPMTQFVWEDVCKATNWERCSLSRFGSWFHSKSKCNRRWFGESNASLGWRGTYSQRFATHLLTTPKPFDPHLHGDMTSTVARGFGYHYYSKSPFPDSYDIVHRRGGGPRGGFAHNVTNGRSISNIGSSSTSIQSWCAWILKWRLESRSYTMD